MVKVLNGTRSRLVIHGTYDGPCGVQVPIEDDRGRGPTDLIVSWLHVPGQRRAKPGDVARLDGGAARRVLQVRQSVVSKGMMLAELGAEGAL